MKGRDIWGGEGLDFFSTKNHVGLINDCVKRLKSLG